MQRDYPALHAEEYCLASELRPVIPDDTVEKQPRLGESIDSEHKTRVADQEVDNLQKEFAAAVVYDVEDSEPATVGKLIRYEFDRPPLVYVMGITAFPR